VRSVIVVVMIVGMGVVPHLWACQLPRPVGEDHVDLGRLYPRPVYPGELHPDVRKAQPCRKALQPLRITAGGDQGAEDHISADPRGRV